MVVFGLGGIGLNVVQGARLVGANMIVGVDINPDRKTLGESFGMTHFVNPNEVEGDLVAYLVDLTKGGADYSFECIGNVDVLGRKHHYWCGTGRHRNFDAAFSTGHGPCMAGDCVWRSSRSYRRAEDRRLVHGRQDQHR